MAKQLDTEEIIDAFYDASYDDIGASRAVWEWINKYLLENPDPKDELPVKTYKSQALEAVIADLELLKRKIDEHLKDAFIIDSSDIGFKYGYYNSIRYILFRWFTISAPGGPYDMEHQVKVPSWYLRCTQMINAIPMWQHCNGAISPIKLVNDMLDITKSYRDACILTEPVIKLGTS